MASGLVPFFRICLSGIEPRAFMFRKRAAPAVGEIKDRHVEYEHGVVPGCAWSKNLAQPAPEIVFTLFRFHCDFVSLQRYWTSHLALRGSGGILGCLFRGRKEEWRVDRLGLDFWAEKMSKSDVHPQPVPSLLWRCGLVVLCVAISTAVTFPVRGFGVRTSVFFPAFLLATWVGGTGAGLLAVLLSTLSINFFFGHPPFQFHLGAQDIPHTVAFLFTALLISSWSTARKRVEKRLRESQDELREARDELESKVKERTADLSRSTDALRTSEEKYRDLIHASPDAICVIDADGKCVLVNPAGIKLAGRSKDELIGSSIADTYLPEERNLLANRLERLKAEGSFRFERKFVRKNGEVVSVEVSLSTLRGRHYQAIIRDITHRKRREALLAGENRVLEMVAKGDSLSDILETLCLLVEEQSSGVLASILLMDSNGKQLRHGGAPNLPKAYTKAIDGAFIGPAVGSCGTAAYRAEQVIVSDIATDPLWADFRELALKHSLRACWSTPIFSSEGKVIGTFAMYYREPRSPIPGEQETIK